MANTVRDEGDVASAVSTPVLVHVSTWEDVLTPPLGLFEITRKFLVGRTGEHARGDGLWLNDPRASQVHLELSRKGDVVSARDAGSSNGTLINGQPLEGEVRLRDGDLLELGRSVLCYREVPDASPPREGYVWGAGQTFSFRLGSLHQQLARLARSSEPILLLGETGVGKEVATKFIHAASGRTGGLVAVDCGALPETLFESTLFGHEKGAFTGATEARVGDIARAHRGTLFLDEVGNLPMATQVKLLRVLETRQVRSVGGREPVDVDVRWVAATNSTLADDSAFRSDLKFRLAGFIGRLPPLRARREDLGLLMGALLREAGVRKASLTRAAAARLFHHGWPGNVRQLRGVLRAAVFLAPDRTSITIDTPALEELELDTFDGAPEPSQGLPAAATPEPRLTAPSREALEQALTLAHGRVTVAARSLGTSARQVYRWLERMDIDPDAFRQR